NCLGFGRRPGGPAQLDRRRTWALHRTRRFDRLQGAKKVEFALSSEREATMIDRRLVLGLMSAAAMAPASVFSQQGNAVLKRAQTSTLDIAYEDSGPQAGFPVLLMHGFPYNPRCYDEALPPLVAAGYRTIVPYLRGF